jgi:hypothetical protein
VRQAHRSNRLDEAGDLDCNERTVSAVKAIQREHPDAKSDDPLFTENRREGIKERLLQAGLRSDAEGRTRDAKSLRQTGISLRLDLGPNSDYRDIAKWARTSPAMIAAFYDQTYPQLSVERIVGFRKQPERPKGTSGRNVSVSVSIEDEE